VTDERTPVAPGTAGQVLAEQILSAASTGVPDEPESERLVLRVPSTVLRAIEALASKSSRSRNYLAVQLLIAGLDSVLANFPDGDRDAVLLASITVAEGE